MIDPSLIALARLFAVRHGLSDALICAICEQESSWNPNAKRYEPAFYTRYIVPLGLPEEEGTFRATSWGLMQTMLESVVEIGYTGTGSELLDPATSLEWGCQLFAKKLAAADGDAYVALQKWNGGGNPNYAPSVIQKMDKYCQPSINLDASDM